MFDGEMSKININNNNNIENIISHKAYFFLFFLVDSK